MSTTPSQSDTEAALWYRAICGTCDEPLDLGAGGEWARTSTDAVTLVLDEGWKRIFGELVCDYCQDVPEEECDEFDGAGCCAEEDGYLRARAAVWAKRQEPKA